MRAGLRAIGSGPALALVAIGLLAVGLRGIGVQYGLPAVYNPDEVSIMARALSFATGTLNPRNFLYPTFYFYVLFAWVAIYLGAVWVTGGGGSLARLSRLYFTDPTGLYTAGRALGVVCGAATVGLLYPLAARLCGSRAALTAALFLAVAPLHVRDSHYVKHDVPATLAVVAAYLAMTRIWPAARGGGHWRPTMLASAATGVAFSTHYYAIFLALPLIVVVVQRWKTAGWRVVARHLMAAGATSALLFFALSPFLLVEPARAWQDITANRQIVIDRAVQSGAFAPALRYLDMLWHDSMGRPVVALGLAGAVWMLRAAPARALLLLAFPVPFLLFIANTAPASRYLNPVLPFVAIFAGWTLSRLADRARAGALLYWALAIAAAAPGLLASVRTDLFFRQDDTRTLAQRDIESRIRPGSTILIQPYSVMLTPSRKGLVEALTYNLGSASAASTKFQIQLGLDPYPQPAYRLIYLGRGGLDAEKIYVDPAQLAGPAGLEPLRRLGVEFVVLKRYNIPDPETQPLLAALTREARRVAAFSPFRDDVPEAEQARVAPFQHNTDARMDAALQRPGPTLEIWQLHAPGS